MTVQFSLVSWSCKVPPKVMRSQLNTNDRQRQSLSKAHPHHLAVRWTVVMLPGVGSPLVVPPLPILAEVASTDELLLSNRSSNPSSSVSIPVRVTLSSGRPFRFRSFPSSISTRPSLSEIGRAYV